MKSLMKRLPAAALCAALILALAGCGNAAEPGAEGGPVTPEYTWTAAYANWTDDDGIYTSALNTEKMIESAVRHVPLFKFESREELGRFRETFSGTLTFDSGYDEVPSFDEAAEAYDDEFFEGSVLFLCYVDASSGSYRFGVTDVSIAGDSICIFADQINDPQVGTCDMAGWFLLVGVGRDAAEGLSAFDTRLGAPEE